MDSFGSCGSGGMLRRMLYRFGSFELDTAKVELRTDGATRPMERQVFALLALLVENRERLVSKDEIVEKVWDGRIVSDSAIASRVKSARQALGDDGKAQRFIKTIHRQGFRFVADVKVTHDAESPALPFDIQLTEQPVATAVVEPASRPSIAVLPFGVVGSAGTYGTAIADALPHELIADLSRLRWLFVTARGSSFRLRDANLDMGEVGRLLGVRYCVTGTIEITGNSLAVTVELVDTRDAGIVWADRFAVTVDEVHLVRTEIRSRILSALELRIPLHEANLARQTETGNLDAWSAYHLGLQHMYRFNRKDNAAATALFEHAVARDAGFARAYAGLSFVHFQTAFMRHTDDVAAEIVLARRYAERGLELDAIDPFVNFTMGRSYWLEGKLEDSLVWLDRACEISPNYAQGIYARALTESMTGLGPQSRDHVDLAMRLSPLDPLYYAMMGTRAFGHMAMQQDAEAALWAERAARSPGAHVLIAMIAVAAHDLHGDKARAAAWAANVRERNASLTRDGFFRSLPIQGALRSRMSDALARSGF